MLMRKRGLGSQLVSASTLLCFTVTTISPSLAWAVEKDDDRAIADTVRAGDALSSHEVARGGIVSTKSQTEPPATDEQLADKSDLKRIATDGREEKPIDKVEALTPDQVAALPTGGDKSGVTSQAISVPKGSGTIQGMGESFSAQLSTGIATFSVPFSLLPARGAAQPSLGLSYSSGSGAGLAGMGWSVGVPFIARQTDRGLPSYDDRPDWHPNQDHFVFNGGQELVPICVVTEARACAGAIPGEVMPDWSARHQYFRPRVEGSFLRFFWSPDHKTWRVQDKSGVTMELGVPLDGSRSEEALEVNPDDRKQIYRWQLARQYDSYGDVNPATGNPAPLNVVIYKYFNDGGQAYLSDIYDTTPKSAPTTTDLSKLAHHTRLEYEPRTDPTESYRSGWLMRQNLRLASVAVSSKTYLGGPNPSRRLVRSYHLDYDAKFHTSYLTNFTVEGRCAGAEGSAPDETDGASCDKLPPMTFEYSHVDGFDTEGTRLESGLTGYEAFDARLKQISGDPPHSIDEELTDYFDINADGLPDVLVTAPGIYGNDFGVFFSGAAGARNAFGAVTTMGVNGVLGADSGTIKLSNANVASLDLDADGIVDLLHMPKVKSYAAYRPVHKGGSWIFEGRVITAANKQSPKVDLGRDAAETRVADVDFDGMVDLVVSTGTELQTFFALGRLPGGDAQFGHGSWTARDRSSLSNDPKSSCVPYSGTPVRFSDPDIQLGDLNGDGITDLVRLRRGDLRYWPGRGNGFWGTGKLDDCPGGTFGDKRYVTTADAPFYSDIQGTSLRLDDVNGDGLDDLVQVRFDAVDVWLNVDGKSWTQRYIIDGTVESPSYANRVRLMDINGSGTRDVVWGNGKRYQYMDLAGGTRPGLLTVVRNGLGKSTTIDYTSSVEEMLEAERHGPCLNGDSFDEGWCAKMPTVTHLVKRVTESDNLTFAGISGRSYVTEYTYRDPVYDGQQREFRGFRKARSKRVGDANSPTDLTDSTFLLGECEDETPDDVDDCAVSERWRDNPKEALKGLPVVTERFDEDGRYLSTVATSYRLRHLYDGLDGRRVRHAFQDGTRTVLYDTAGAFASRQPVNLQLVTEERSRPASVVTPDMADIACEAQPGEGALAPEAATAPSYYLLPVPLRASTGYAVTTTASRVDAVGNQVIAVANGCIEGSVCPIDGDDSLAADERICSFSQPQRLESNGSAWLYRTTASWSRGSVDTVKRALTSTTYTAEGAPKTVQATLTGTIPLLRSSSYAPRVKAPVPASKAEDGTFVVSDSAYDAFGNLIREQSADNRCRDIYYEVALDAAGASYAQLPTLEVVHIDGCPASGAAVPTTSLTTIAEFDRGLGQAVAVTDMAEQQTTVRYDGFGRITELFRPRTAGGTAPTAPTPSVRISYDLPPAGSGRAYSIIHTRTQDGASVDDAGSYLETYSYVDGMGRARVGLAEADEDEDGAPFIVSSIADFDAKGAVRRKYLPHFADVDPAELPIASAVPNVQYGRQRYDAFGRQVQTFDVDGTVTLQSKYHALSTDLWDAADLYPGPHQGSYASTRTDGHGRTVATTERVHANGMLEAYEVRTRYVASGQPQVITRVNLTTNERVARWMVYDSLGRMVINADPHATVNFTPAPSTSDTIKAWRYVYNRSGDLVGTSDARGCGQNFEYDGAGRLKAEDYSPCVKLQPDYVTPSLATGARYEVFYEYDDSPSTIVTAPMDFVNDVRLRGRLKAVHDRGATTWFQYDERGRTTRTYRKISYSGAPQTTVAGRYVDRWYHKDFSYDAADRPTSEGTGLVRSAGVTDTSALLASDNTSAVTTHYTKRGTIKAVTSSYGDLVKQLKRSADGLVQSMKYGDGAETETAMRYDTRRRLSSVQTVRLNTTQWSTAPPAITPAPGPADLTRQQLLQDLDYSYDVVGNPTEIRDWRIPDEWPEGAKPVSRRMEYDDLYRVTRVDYEYPGGFDKFTSPYAAEINGQLDPRRPAPRGHKLLSKRPLWQTYRYDWLGNTSHTDDDQHVFYERSLGAITHNTPAGAQARPYQLLSAAQSVSGRVHNGSTMGNVGYDEAGNLIYIKVAENTTACATQLSACWSRFWYEWDEVGRLQEARRVEGEGPNATGPRMTFLYDANDDRVLKTHSFNTSSGDTPEVTTAYIFDSLELRRAQFDTVTKQYPVSDMTEVAYLNANGVRLARLHYEAPAKGEPQLATPSALHASNLHVFLSLPDHLGSSSLTIDHASGELVEARTYQPYGATESDYRPERWKGFREDYGFTGKEEDIEVGVQYFGKRYLSPYLGRWLSADPLAVQKPGDADFNIYSYVRGAVLKAIDPLGLQEFPSALAIASAPTEEGDAASVTTDGKTVGFGPTVETASASATLAYQDSANSRTTSPSVSSADETPAPSSQPESSSAPVLGPSLLDPPPKLRLGLGGALSEGGGVGGFIGIEVNPSDPLGSFALYGEVSVNAGAGANVNFGQLSHGQTSTSFNLEPRVVGSFGPIGVKIPVTSSGGGDPKFSTPFRADQNLLAPNLTAGLRGGVEVAATASVKVGPAVNAVLEPAAATINDTTQGYLIGLGMPASFF